jgi:hypothetical protein
LIEASAGVVHGVLALLASIRDHAAMGTGDPRASSRHRGVRIV